MIGSVAELRRYPVKSLAGESLTAVHVDQRGLAGDRRWAVVDESGRLGSTKSTRRFRRMDGLLQLTADSAGDDGPLIGFPDGRRIPADDPRVHEALSDHVGRPVQLRAEGGSSHFDDGPLHLVTTASLAALAEHHGATMTAARFRSNLLVDVGSDGGFVENDWIGQTLAVGSELVLDVLALMPRCVMVDLPQHELRPAPGLLDTVGRHNQGCLGVVAEVVHDGIVRLGDPIRRLA